MSLTESERQGRMLAAATALFNYHVKNEDAIVGTIAFAWYVEQPTTEVAEKHEEIEVLGTAGNVAVLRLKKVSAAVVEREGAHFPRAVKMSVYSKHAKPREVAAQYKAVLLDRFIEYGGSRGGNIGWSFQDSFAARGNLTASAKRELAKDLSALANAQGGLLVIGVKDPEREGEPPAHEDFVGIAVPETFARDLESSLLGSVSPPLYPLVRVTEDDFEDPETGERRRFVVVGVCRGSRLRPARSPIDA